jgi:hypothetical protein
MIFPREKGDDNFFRASAELSLSHPSIELYGFRVEFTKTECGSFSCESEIVSKSSLIRFPTILLSFVLQKLTQLNTPPSPKTSPKDRLPLCSLRYSLPPPIQSPKPRPTLQIALRRPRQPFSGPILFGSPFKGRSFCFQKDCEVKISPDLLPGRFCQPHFSALLDCGPIREVIEAELKPNGRLRGISDERSLSCGDCGGARKG